MNINTPAGLAQAVKWQQDHIARVVDNGRWVVPRSGSIIVICHGTKEAVRVAGLFPEPDIEKVFKAMGWKWIDKA